MRRKAVLIPLILLLLPFVMSEVTIDVQAQPTVEGIIAVSVTSLAGIVQEIGGTIYNTTVLVKQEADPHAFTITPEILDIANNADLLVFTGHFHWEQDLANQTSTPYITYHNVGAVENYDDFGAELSPMPGVGLGGEHDNEGNPHGFWLLPSNALAVANATRSALISLNSTFASELNSNFDAFEEALHGFKEKIGILGEDYGFSDMQAVVVFPAEAYVAEAFGVTPVAVLQVEEITISGPMLYDVQQALKNGSVDLILGSDISKLQSGGEFAYQLQADNGGILVWWKTIFFAESNYLWMMNYNLDVLINGIEEGPQEIVDNTLNIGLAAMSGVLSILVVIETVLLIIRAKEENQ
jgi:ABC-type Zn uptake system ZnuABC Zn-binding protein ZnuA